MGPAGEAVRAASGTLPTEQAKLMIATNGPPMALSIRVRVP